MATTRNEDQRVLPRGRVHLLKDALYTILRAIARHVGGFYGALGTFVTVSFVVAAGAVALFVAVASSVQGGLTQSIDEKILQFFQSQRTDLLDKVMIQISMLGTGIVLFMIVAIASVFLWLTKHHWSVYILLMGVIGGQFANGFLKNSFQRERPSVVDWVTDVHSLSFPSGHAMTSMIAYGSVAYLVARLEPTPRLRHFTWVLAAIVILLIGISRMYLGVHYPSDVFAGYLAGCAWLGFVAASVKAVQFFAPRRPETKKEEKDLNAEEQRGEGAVAKAPPEPAKA